MERDREEDESKSKVFLLYLSSLQSKMKRRSSSGEKKKGEGKKEKVTELVQNSTRNKKIEDALILLRLSSSADEMNNIDFPCA